MAGRGSWSISRTKSIGHEIRKEMETTSGWENWYRHVGKDWGKVIIGQATVRNIEKLGGKSVAEIAKALNQDPWDAFFRFDEGRRIRAAGKHDGGEQNSRAVSRTL